MFPEQRTISFHQNISTPTPIRTTINYPITSNLSKPSLPISPQNAYSSNIKSTIDKNFLQSHSTHALIINKEQDTNKYQLQNYPKFKQPSYEPKMTDIHSPKTRLQPQNFDKLKSFLNKNKEGQKISESPQKNFLAKAKDKEEKGKQLFTKTKKQRKENPCQQKPNFSPSKLKMNLLNFKADKLQKNEGLEIKKSPRAYLRMTLDARIEPRTQIMEISKQDKQQINNLAKTKSPRASHKPQRTSIQGSFWKNKSPVKKNNNSLTDNPPSMTKKPSDQEKQAGKSVKNPLIQHKKTGTAQKNPQINQMTIPPLKIKASQNSNASKGNFIPYRKSRNNFKIIKNIGNGLFSDNYLAMDKKTGWIFCLKTIRKGSVLSAPGEAVQNFIKQYKAHFIMDDPNIISIYDIFCDDSFIYILCQLMTGGTLKEYLCGGSKKTKKDIVVREREGENEQQRKDIELIQKISGINYALEAIHSQYNTPHGNVNPSNIFISFDVCKISKFIVHEQKNCRKTPLNYTPPEMLVGRPITCQADMWCLGLLIFQMAAQRSLFDSSSSEENDLAHQILQLRIDSELSKIKIISNPLKQIIRSLLKINPQQRLSSTALLTTSLFKIYEQYKHQQPIKQGQPGSQLEKAHKNMIQIGHNCSKKDKQTFP